MGAEAACVATYRKRTSSGTALLETDYLLFRGDFRLRISFADIQAVASSDGQLTLKFGGESASFELGRRSETWAKKIRAPKSVLDKLGVTTEQSVAVLGIGDERFIRELRDRARDLATDRRRKSRDLVFLGTESAADLAEVASIEPLLTRDGAVWVVYPKGQKRLTEADVLAAGRAAGFVDVKVVRFSDTHTALKFVIPVARR